MSIREVNTKYFQYITLIQPLPSIVYWFYYWSFITFVVKESENESLVECGRIESKIIATDRLVAVSCCSCRRLVVAVVVVIVGEEGEEIVVVCRRVHHHYKKRSVYPAAVAIATTPEERKRRSRRSRRSRWNTTTAIKKNTTGEVILIHSFNHSKERERERGDISKDM